ncbi:hypothetical protein HII28_10480 [Planctomonas sp. JC2975]|uniref:hypothetical protein n=1 Tax=Planctomonas sp. JC2975 TaxID=2729626 RepID=UPI0014764C6C|nr:hypothetical protein [Planctomonas sp. JC2975]NNC12301.1 hypothetical protein [Planctomonas sp. JC2975]
MPHHEDPTGRVRTRRTRPAAPVAVMLTGVALASFLAACASATPASTPVAAQTDGQSAAQADSQSKGVMHTIPPLKPGVLGPSPAPTAKNQPLTADQASLQQLWAGVTSGPSGTPTNRAAGEIPQSFTDFADAIAKRCAPILTADQTSTLATLRQTVTTTAASAGTDLGPSITAYVDAATKDCMN